MRQVSVWAFILALTAIMIGCSGGDSGLTSPGISGDAQGQPGLSPSADSSSPTPNDDARSGSDTSDESPELTDENVNPLQGQPIQGSHALWGLFEFFIDPEENTFEIVPLRNPDLHLNTIKFLEPNGQVGLVQLVGGLNWNNDKTVLDIDIRITHPFPGAMHFSGFDVKGILITKGTMEVQSDPELIMSGADELRLMNADGYTRWWNPREFVGNNVFSYIDGALGFKDSVWHFSSTLNGYKYFCDTLGPNAPVNSLDTSDRGVFRAGSSNMRHYTLSVPSLGQLRYNYAIDASWKRALVKPPEVPDDFPPEANQPEPWHISTTIVENTLYYDEDLGEQGGELTLDVFVYDWQNPSEAPAGSIERVSGEWPGLFDPTSAEYVSSQAGYSTWSLTLTPNAGSLVNAEEVEYLVWGESTDGGGYGGILDPGVPLISANLFTATVAPEEPNLSPQVSEGVIGNASPGLFPETYTVVASDPNDDTLSYSWTCEPNIIDDPGNGDGTIEIDWADYGFGNFTVQCLVSDGFNPAVPATPLDVMVGNVPPSVGDIEGPTDVSAADTDAKYSVVATDPDDGQTLEYNWSFVLDGEPHDFNIPGDPVDGSLTLDFSNIDPDIYSINVEVSDGYADIRAVPITVTHNNTPPDVGAVDGKNPVTSLDVDELYSAPWSDPDNTQTLSFAWSIVPEGDPEDFSLPSNPDGSINIDWTAYSVGDWSVNVRADDGIDQTSGTALVVTKENTAPTVGEVSGPTEVDSTFTDAEYSAPIDDIDTDQALTATWSIVPTGDPADYTLPSEPDLSLVVDWSLYADGDYDVNVRVDDGFAQVEGTLLTVTKMDNMPPVAGDVTGPVSVYHSDLSSEYNAPISDPEGDPLDVYWSVVQHGDPADYSIPGNETDPLIVDWSDYPALGQYDVNVQVQDPFNPPVEGNMLVVTILNTPPTVGAVSGPTPVNCDDTSASYSAPIDDIDPLQTHTILWSVVPSGNPPDYTIPALGDGSVDIDWSGYALGDYDVNVSVDDGYGSVEGTLLTVTRANTPPEVGAVTGPSNVNDLDVENYALDPVTTDCESDQTLSFWFSVEPQGDPPDYSINQPIGELTIDWSSYGVGIWTVGCMVTDGIDESYATPLDVTVSLHPCTGGAHTYLGQLTPSRYSVMAMSVLPRADVAFLEGGQVGLEGLGVAQIGPSTIGVLEADNVSDTSQPWRYFLGKQDAAISIDTDPIEGRILVVTALEPHIIKIIDSSIIMGNPIIGTIDSFDPAITYIALDVEADGDFWVVQRDASTDVTYNLIRFNYLAEAPYYEVDAGSTTDVTTQTDTETDIFDIAINNYSEMLYLLEAGPLQQGTMHTYHVVDGFPAQFMGTLGSVLFSQPLDFDEGGWTGFAGYADIDVDHVDASQERCRILLYGRLQDLSSELIRMDSLYNVLDTQTYTEAWPAFAINPDPDPSVRNLIMPGTDSLGFWETPTDW